MRVALTVNFWLMRSLFFLDRPWVGVQRLCSVTLGSQRLKVAPVLDHLLDNADIVVIMARDPLSMTISQVEN